MLCGSLAREYRFIVVGPNGVLDERTVDFIGGSLADDLGFTFALIDFFCMNCADLIGIGSMPAVSLMKDY